jgi:hypothetical protein
VADSPRELTEFRVLFVGLHNEFGARLDGETIRRVADQELTAFADARIRKFVSILALRRARARLQTLSAEAPSSTHHQGNEATG